MTEIQISITFFHFDFKPWVSQVPTLGGSLLWMYYAFERNYKQLTKKNYDSERA